MALKQDGVQFVLCPKQGSKIEGVVVKQGTYFRISFSVFFFFFSGSPKLKYWSKLLWEVTPFGSVPLERSGFDSAIFSTAPRGESFRHIKVREREGNNREFKQQRRWRLRNVTLKVSSRCFKLYRTYSISFSSSNVAKFFWSWITAKRLYQTSSGKEKESCCCFANLNLMLFCRSCCRRRRRCFFSCPCIDPYDYCQGIILFQN